MTEPSRQLLNVTKACLDNCEQECERLRALNAELLAACQAMHDHAVEYARINNLFNSDGTPATFHELLQARAAIANALRAAIS